MNDLDEWDGLTECFGEDDSVECGEERVLSWSACSCGRT